MGFEPSINQRLLPPTFPRYICINSFESTLNELNLFINQLEKTLEINKMNNFYNIFVSFFFVLLLFLLKKQFLLKDFMLKFGDQKPSVLNRSILQVKICFFFVF